MRVFRISKRAYNDPPVDAPPAPAPTPPPPAPAPQLPGFNPDLAVPPELVSRSQFTQSDVNSIFAATKKKYQTDNQSLVTRLEQLQQDKNLTQQQRDALQGEIDSLKQTYETKDQQHQQTVAKLEEKNKKMLDSLTGDRDTWKNRFEQTIIRNEILQSANSEEAFNASQIEAILLPLTKIEEETQQGQPTGNFVTKVKFTGRDKDKKAVQLVLSVPEAVKAMKDMPDLYGNLFKNGSVNGLNGNPAMGQPAQTMDLDAMSPQDYQKNRTQILAQMGKRS